MVQQRSDQGYWLVRNRYAKMPLPLDRPEKCIQKKYCIQLSVIGC